MVGFEIVAEEATVKIIYHEAGDLERYVYRKFDPTEPGGTKVWYTTPNMELLIQEASLNPFPYQP
ncbi:MAG: hypothetical protein DRP01_11205 [Archaeoglobales archaeon]|nr:MAG: hypothetical protein DRP01_11205 [Archaeoglobales archaeon]